MKNKNTLIDNLTFAEHPFATDLTGGLWAVITTVDDRLHRIKTMGLEQAFAVLKLPHLQTTVRKAAEARLRKLGNARKTSHTNPAIPATVHFPFPVLGDGFDVDTTTLHEAFEATTWTYPAVINSQLTQLATAKACGFSGPSASVLSSPWIACADQLPDADQTVLICNDLWDDPVFMGYTDGEIWFTIEGHQFLDDDRDPAPTHWMHLPESPGT